MLPPEGSIKILDFGLAQFRHPPSGVSVSDTRLTQPGAVIGPPGYMAPEQLRGADPDFRADLFAFGVTLYELTTGRPPFVADDPVTTLVRVLEAVTPEPPSYASDRAQIGTLDSASGARPVSRSPLWWWQLHQIFVAVLLYAMLIPLWVVRGWTSASIGNTLFFGAVGATLRLQLWFTSRVYPSELRTQRHKTARWVRGADWAFALVLLGAAAATISQTTVAAMLLVGIAIATLVSSLVIEPATTRAAFPQTDAR